MTRDDPLFYLTRALERRRRHGLHRELREVETPAGAWAMIEGRRLLNLSSNNYLGFANHPVLKEAAQRALKEWGIGVGASRLVSGEIPLYRELEDAIARFKGTESSLVFPSGYAANLGTIPALAGRGDAIYADSLSHASIIDGCRLSGARVHLFPHNDPGALRDLMRREPPGRRALVVTEGVFSMDGDIARLPDLVEIAEEHGAAIMVDEAHSVGFLGRGGRGAVDHFGLSGRVPVAMGTLGKALGSYGAYVAGDRALRGYLIQEARSLIYSTGLPPAALGASRAAMDLIMDDPSAVERLRANARRLREGLRALGFSCGRSETQIIPLIVGEPRRAMALASALRDEGVLAVGIRPPTVPRLQSRVRLSVMATHTDDEIDLALRAVERAAHRTGVLCAPT